MSCHNPSPDTHSTAATAEADSRLLRRKKLAHQKKRDGETDPSQTLSSQQSVAASQGRPRPDNVASGRGSRRRVNGIEVQPQAPGLQDRQGPQDHATKVIWAIHNFRPLTAPSVGSGSRDHRVASEPALTGQQRLSPFPRGAARFTNPEISGDFMGCVAAAGILVDPDSSASSGWIFPCRVGRCLKDCHDASMHRSRGRREWPLPPIDWYSNSPPSPVVRVTRYLSGQLACGHSQVDQAGAKSETCRRGTAAAL